MVSTRVLSPRYAVIWAAFFNFIAFLVFHTAVASTIARDVVAQDALTVGVIFAGLVGAIGWNLLTFWLGLPTSSSHALVGGLAGAAVARYGFDVLVSEGLQTIGVFIVLSPLIGLGSGAHAAASSSSGPSTRCATSMRSTRVSDAASWCRRRRSASATGATTPRRPWGSCWPC